MAVEIENNASRYDRFKVRCPHCGRDLVYSREDIRPHHRWPNGFIYCPGCHQPVGHKEENLFEQGQEVLKEEAIKKENAKVETSPSQLRLFRKLRTIFLAVGIPVMVIGAILFTIGICGVFGQGVTWFFFFVFNNGLALTIAAAVMSRLINNRKNAVPSIEKKEEIEMKENQE